MSARMAFITGITAANPLCRLALRRMRTECISTVIRSALHL